MRLNINFLVQQTPFIQTSFLLWKYPISHIIIFLMLRWPGLIKRYYQEKVYISSGCQTSLFHMWPWPWPWPCHKQRNCMSCTNGAQSCHTQYWEQLLCVAIHHHFHRTTYCRSRYEILAMQDSKISMHDVASPSPAFDTDDGDDGSSPCHVVLVSRHSLHDNPQFYSPRSQSCLSKTKHIQSNAWRRKDGNESVIRATRVTATPKPIREKPEIPASAYRKSTPR